MVEWDAQSIAVVIAATAAAVSGVIAAIRLSRCTTVDCFCFHMRREVPPESPRVITAAEQAGATALV
jgi:hypothetical protein